MKPFTTSKGEFIAVPVHNKIHNIQIHGHGRNNNILFYDEGGYAHNEWFDFEIEFIGLSSDILKDEALAKKVVAYNKSLSKCFENPCESFKSVLLYHNVTGNQLIIKKI